MADCDRSDAHKPVAVPAQPIACRPSTGRFARDDKGTLAFHRCRGLDADAARALTPLVQDRVLRLFVRHGFLDPAQAADMRTSRGTGGFSLDGSVRVAAHDRFGLERLIRGVAILGIALGTFLRPGLPPISNHPLVTGSAGENTQSCPSQSPTSKFFAG